MKYIRLLLIPVKRLYEKLKNPWFFKTRASLIIYSTSTYDFGVEVFFQKIMKMKRFQPILNFSVIRLFIQHFCHNPCLQLQRKKLQTKTKGKKKKIWKIESSNANVNVNLMSNTGSACAISRARGSWKSADNNPDRIGIWKCWFLRRGENRSTRRKNLSEQGRQPTTNSTHICRW